MKEIVSLSNNELRQLQLIELEMLVEVDRICRKNQINYSIDAGSLLGAVRHKGFIPWDDDLDVMFLHDDYERFYEACKTDLDTTRFFFQDYRNDPGYRWGYGKIRRLGTEYIKAGQEKLKQRTGICIDVFDFENVPDNSTERKRFVRQMFVIRKILYSALGRTNERHAILRLWYSILYYLIPSSFAHKIRTKITAKYLDQDTQNVACMMWPIKKYPYGFPCSLFASHIDLEFEGIKAMAIQGYDEYLRMRYGDYMKLPPEDQRRGVMEAVEYRFIDITHEEILEEYSLHGSKK